MTSATREEFANSATQNRELAPEPAHAAFSAPAAARPESEAADVDMNMDEPARAVPSSSMIQTPSKPNQPAATVMFESGMAPVDAPLARMERLSPEPEPEPVASEPSKEVAEPQPPAPSSRPTPTRSKFKAKPLPKKGAKGRSGKASGWSTANEDAEEPKPTSSKAPMIAAIAVAVLALIGAGVYFLRGHGEPTTKEPTKTAEPTPAQAEPKPSEEPAALAPKVGFEPPVKPVPAATKPAPTEKPAHAEKPAPAEKPAHAEKAAAAEKPKAEPAAPEPKASAGKPNEEDFRRANEAYERGNAKLFQGNTAEAIGEFNQALKLNPKDPAIHRGLGLAYAQSGKTAEATKHLKLYLKAAPKATDRAIIEKRIDQLHGH
jgi:hypothetical protein